MKEGVPPEDCGGIPGYENILKTLKHPGTDENNELVVWLDGKTDTEFIDIRMLNAHLDLLSEYIRKYEDGEKPSSFPKFKISLSTVHDFQSKQCIKRLKS